MANGDGNKVVFSISMSSILRVFLILVLIGFAWLIRDIIALVFVSLILASAFDPTVDYLQQRRIPRAFGIILIYIVFFSALTVVVIGISRPIANEVRNIAQDIPHYYQEINNSLDRFQYTPLFANDKSTSFRGGLDQALANLTQLASGNVLPVASAIFGGVITIMLALVITFYFSVQESAVKQFIVWLTPKGKEEKTAQIIEKIQSRLGLWLRGQLLLSFVIFVITYVGLKILGIQYALVLALLAGFFEVVPYLGPILSAVPAIFLTLISPWGGWFKAGLVLILYVVVQQAENNIVVPKIMARTVGLNPLIVIVSILIGAKVGGVAGALVAVPIATALDVVLSELGYKKELVP
ncbi:MAG: AI-2E family transporter [Candidatus Komeilibacteria bacterium]|nr:AI-2E family transporter [Candidatus Komeilibacteria bacterium]